jgi:ATP/maltotriose-dependent transcriptional regulator MalT
MSERVAKNLAGENALPANASSSPAQECISVWLIEDNHTFRNEDYGLTAREKTILELMTQGLLKKEIAGQLSLSYHTVDTHLRNIYAKLHVNTRTGAVAKALKERLF